MLQILFRWLELKIEIRRRLECVFYLILFSKKMEKWEKIGFFSLVGHPRFTGRWCPSRCPQDIQSICYCLHTGTFRLDTRNLLVAGVPISISSKYLYLYLALKVLTNIAINLKGINLFERKNHERWSLYVFVIHHCMNLFTFGFMYL